MPERPSTHFVQAQVLESLICLDLLGAEAAVQWADAVILTELVTENWMIALSLCNPSDRGAILDQLLSITGSAPRRTDCDRALLAAFAVAIEARPSLWERIAKQAWYPLKMLDSFLPAAQSLAAIGAQSDAIEWAGCEADVRKLLAPFRELDLIAFGVDPADIVNKLRQ